MWKTVKLGDVCELLYGKALDKKDRVDSSSVPAYGANGVKTFSKKSLYDKPSIIIGRKGSAGELNKVAEPFWALDVTYYVRIEESVVDLDFLFYTLTTLNLPSMARGVKPGINRNDVYEKTILLPPLAEQKRIVAKLDAAFAEIDKATTATHNLSREEKKLKKLIVFEKINSLPFSCHQSFGDVCSFVRGPFGGSLKKSMFVETGFAVYEQQHPINNQFDSFRYFVSEEKFNEMKRFEVKTGDIVMSCSGVTLGRTGIVPDYAPTGIINQALLKITPNEYIDCEYLQIVMWSDLFQRLIWGVSGGAAQPNVPPVKVIKELNLPVPSLEVQRQIVEWKQTLDKLKLSEIYSQKQKVLIQLKAAILAEELQSKAA